MCENVIQYEVIFYRSESFKYVQILLTILRQDAPSAACRGSYCPVAVWIGTGWEWPRLEGELQGLHSPICVGPTKSDDRPGTDKSAPSSGQMAHRQRRTVDLRGFQCLSIGCVSLWCFYFVSWHCLDLPHQPVLQANRRAWKAVQKLTLHSPIHKNQVLCAEFIRG